MEFTPVASDYVRQSYAFSDMKMPAQAIQPRPANAPRGADADLETTLRRMAVRRRILAVAKHRFARFGYEHVSMQDVARGADVDWQDFLLYFEDKPSLLTAILD